MPNGPTACRSLLASPAALLLALALCGCQSVATQPLGVSEREIAALDVPDAAWHEGMTFAGPQPLPVPQHLPPAELAKVSLPTYRLEPPDVVRLELIRRVPHSPYRLEAGDRVQLEALVPGDGGPRVVDGIIAANGTLPIPGVGAAPVAGLTLAEAAAEVQEQLGDRGQEVEIRLTLTESSRTPPLAGDFLVTPDGTLNLGVYGSVYVAGKTVGEARAAVEQLLAIRLERPEVDLSVASFNSKAYFVVTEGAGLGDRVHRFPITGNETVLDAISQVGGLTHLSSKRIWIARPAPGGSKCGQILPVDWDEITKSGSTATNYQILPGDRVFIAEDRLVALDVFTAKLVSPLERLFGVSLLGGQTVQTMQRFPAGQP